MLPICLGDKWEAWNYNEDVTATLWNDNDHYTSKKSMRHEAAMLQTHPSMLAFLVGSDYWPSDRATATYVEALNGLDWPNPVICSAAKRGYPDILGPSGLKMNGPYDWVPPNYWYDGDQLGSAFGFGSELGAGVGTPEIGSLRKFLSESDMQDLWTKPKKGLYHMSTNASQFHDRKIYNNGLYNRYGDPTSLEDYLFKAQIMDYEATRAEYEAYAANWNANRPATGLIYWMLNNAWPSLHWNQFDYYLHPAGSYYGTKVGCRTEHVAYDYVNNAVYLINHSLNSQGQRVIEIELMDVDGHLLASSNIRVDTEPNRSTRVGAVPGVDKIKDVAFLRLILKDVDNQVLSRNVYWLASTLDTLRWGRSTWYHTPVGKYADFTALNNMRTASIKTTIQPGSDGSSTTVAIINQADVPAFFIRLNLIDADGQDVVPVYWSDNHVTLWPHESMKLELSYETTTSLATSIEVSGFNVDSNIVIA